MIDWLLIYLKNYGDKIDHKAWSHATPQSINNISMSLCVTHNNWFIHMHNLSCPSSQMRGINSSQAHSQLQSNKNMISTWLVRGKEMIYKRQWKYLFGKSFMEIDKIFDGDGVVLEDFGCIQFFCHEWESNRTTTVNDCIRLCHHCGILWMDCIG